MNRVKSLLFLVCCLSTVLCALTAEAATKRMSVTVDATDISRKLLHTEIRLPVTPGPLTLWYPKWVPGVHSPSGPVQNIAGLYFETASGESLTWQRDLQERHQFHIEVPKGTSELIIRLDYICNQPTTNSIGVDSFGTSLLGVINWNTILMYPDGTVNDQFDVDLSVTLPEGWGYGTALAVKSEKDGRLDFKRGTLQHVMDSPLICGEYSKDFPLDVKDMAPVTLHVVAESLGGLQYPDDLIEKFSNMATEAGALFGGTPFDEYHFLLTGSNEIPNNGLEHLRSSFNSLDERALLKDDGLKGWGGNLLPHEFIHAWCGKYRRPEGMDTRNYSSIKDTKHLWVYEGLTTYVANVVAVRGGVWDVDHYRERLASTISHYMHTTGRQWRSLEDTAIDSYHLRAGSPSWSTMRRGQDYYDEGALIWMEADAIIRLETNGARSLDDFCKAFMGDYEPKNPIYSYTDADIVAALDSVLEYDWDGFLARHITQTQETLPLDIVEKLGYRLQYSTERSDNLKKREKDYKRAYATDSIGISVSSSGAISGSMVKGMPADQAGLAPGMKIIGVNGRTFSLDRFRDGIADSVVKQQIEFLIEEGDVLRTITVDYADGTKYLELVRDEERPDIFAEIMTPVMGE